MSIKVRHLYPTLLFLFAAGGTLFSSCNKSDQTTVKLLHFSDYHSHAVPFYAEGQANSAGVARAIAYLEPFANDNSALIFSGGDMMNKSSPAWSDKYHCAEWPWFNGIVDAMAYGNHDADYGSDVFKSCQDQIGYPILGSNVLDSTGNPLFTDLYKVFEVNGIKIGVFASAGGDFNNLLKPETYPTPEVSFTNRIESAQNVVNSLRNTEKVDAVILIGHALYEDDLALAKAVPGIDLIFGSHSHRLEALNQIEGTQTKIISSGQYLTYLSEVSLVFNDRQLTSIKGNLVKMSPEMPQSIQIANRVDKMQADLSADPDYAYLYDEIGHLTNELSTAGQFETEATLGNFVTDIVREKTTADLAIFLTAGFRQPIPPGIVTEEDLRTALPYQNSVLVYEMTGLQIKELLNYSVSRMGSDYFSQISGMKIIIHDKKLDQITVMTASGPKNLLDNQVYRVATNNFQGLYAGGYKEIFAQANYTETGLDVWQLIRDHLSKK